MCIDIRTLAYVRMYMCVYIYVYVSIYFCMCIYVHIYVFIYICTHTLYLYKERDRERKRERERESNNKKRARMSRSDRHGMHGRPTQVPQVSWSTVNKRTMAIVLASMGTIPTQRNTPQLGSPSTRWTFGAEAPRRICPKGSGQLACCRASSAAHR